MLACTHFAHGRLQAHVNSHGLEPVACVDINLEEAKKGVESINGAPEGLSERIYTTITEAKEKHDAEACLVYASTTVHAKLIVESLNLGMHTICVKPIATTQAEFRDIIQAHKANPGTLLCAGTKQAMESCSCENAGMAPRKRWYR